MAKPDPHHDPRIDAIIAAAPQFARPVMTKLRAWVHKHCPGVEETLKWGHSSFLRDGKILCGFAVFKAHCTFGFWHPMMREKERGEAMGQFGRMTSVRDLPSEAEFRTMIRDAMRLQDEGAKPPVKKKPPKPALPTPDDLLAALSRNAKARKTFDAFSPSQRRDYIEWITEARRPATRQQRLATTLQWLAEGKSRNWKYEPK